MITTSGNGKLIKGLKAMIISYIVFISLAFCSIILMEFFAFKFTGSVNIWIKNTALAIEISNEILCFSVVSLSIFVVLCIKNFSKLCPIKIYILIGIALFIIPIMSVMMIVQGRLVYQINNLVLSEEINTLLLSFYLACQHILFLAFGAMCFTFVFFREIKLPLKLFSAFTGVLVIIGSFPYLFSNIINIVIFTIFIIWNGYVIFAIINELKIKEGHPTTAST